MIKIQDPSTPVVVLRSNSHGGLNIMRSLGRLGVSVYNVDPHFFAPANGSRYCRGKFLWDIEHRPAPQSVEYLLHAQREIGRPCILIPTTDRTARFVGTYAQALGNGFIFPKQSAELSEALSSKKDMFGLARRHGIPTPDAVFPKSREDVLHFLGGARFPIMIKGIDGQRLRDRTGKKMFKVRSADELLECFDAAEDFANPNLMLQEYIPGGDDTVWMFNGYFNERSECLVGFTGKKIRQCPVYTGSASLGICLHNETVHQLTLKFMRAIGYRGILDIGFRYDARDGQYKVLDANPRIGASFRLFVGKNGMDVARALYLDLTGQEVICESPRERRKWVVEDHDLVSSYRYYRDGKLTFKQWINSYEGVEEAAFLAKDDPLPLLLMVIARVKELFQRTFGISKHKLQPQSKKVIGLVSHHPLSARKRSRLLGRFQILDSLRRIGL